jgi:REP element-mobilizing transposase RayT
MARVPRLEVPFGYFHLVTRGNNKQEILDDWTRAQALARLERTARKFDWHVFAWAFMTNHVHVVLQLGEGGLSAGMRELNTGIANDSNFRFGRINHCFGQRFWSTHIRTDAHLLASIRYTLWNPARAGMGEHPAESGWTSFRAAAGIEMPHEALALPRLLGHFGSKPGEAQRAFKRFIWDGRERCLAPWQSGAGILR